MKPTPTSELWTLALQSMGNADDDPIRDGLDSLDSDLVILHACMEQVEEGPCSTADVQHLLARMSFRVQFIKELYEHERAGANEREAAPVAEAEQPPASTRRKARRTA